MSPRRYAILFWLCVVASLVAARLAHVGLLWPDEDYHLAAAIQVLHGKALYRDVWYDKPPLTGLIYAALGAPVGWALRIFDALFAVGCCALAYRFAGQLWSRKEGFLAAALLALSLIFDDPRAVISLAPDTLLLAPHLAAVYLAWKKRSFWTGLVCGAAFLLNTKAAFVLLACGAFGFGGWPLLCAGFLLPNVVAAGWLAWTGALSGYLDQVWRWGLLYAGDPIARVTVERGLVLLVKWAGFHAALLIGAGFFWWRERDQKQRRLVASFALWAVISLTATALGWRFYPQYFMQVLPPFVIAGARGMAEIVWPRGDSAGSVWMKNRGTHLALMAILLAALLFPIVRFNPFRGRQESAMAGDSRDTIRLIEAVRRPGDSIFIWGSRPDIIAWTRLPIGSRLWDSQPLTMVPANRHLATNQPMDAEWSRENRLELVKSRASIVVDGLSQYNPGLDIHRYPELAEWIGHYCVAGGTALTTVYRLCEVR